MRIIFLSISIVATAFNLVWGMNDAYLFVGDSIDKPWYAKVDHKSYELYIDLEEQKYVAITENDPTHFVPWYEAMTIFPEHNIDPNNYRSPNEMEE